MRRPWPLALELGDDDLVDVEEAVLLEADLDERGLHPRQDVVDRAEVDVPGDRPPLGPLEVDLGDAVVLEDGDALLADVDRDEQLALRGRERRALLRDAAAGLVRAALTALRANLLLLLLRLAASGSVFAAVAAAVAVPRLLAALAAAGAAAPLRAGGIGGGRLFPAGRGGGRRYVWRRRWSGCLRCRRLLRLIALSSEPGKWQTVTPCSARAPNVDPRKGPGRALGLWCENRGIASLPGYQCPRRGPLRPVQDLRFRPSATPRRPR